ncbi:MAG: hypothetical protein BGO27_00760 [Alphaproteobacteria bacterium 33-17]|nr:MAG: hypothetical protein BGO27_00760 [Alphaproteobacteria bacterium 33-17]
MEFNVIMIQHLLMKNGFKNVFTAKNGIEAIEITKKEIPDLVILDLMMPEMDGFEYCTIIRKEERFANLPIIVQTATNLTKQKTQAFSCGATDFVNKPIDPEELIARIKVHLENHILLEKLQNYQERLRSELTNAQKMQEALMPNDLARKLLLENYGLKIQSYFLPSLEIGGDFWSFDPIDEDRVAFHITDFSGHGIGAAINTFRLHTIISELKDKSLKLSSAEAVNHINHSLTAILARGQFATLLYGIFDLKNDQIEYTACGSPPGFILNIREKTIRKIDSAGLPIGISSSYSYEHKTSDFKKGDILILYSDALIETEDLHGNMLGLEKLESMLTNYINSTNSLMSEKLFDHIMETFAKNYMMRLTDDYTLVFFERI